MSEALSPERWERVEALFFDALEQPPEERQAFLADACGEEPSLRDEVLSLLQADSEEVRRRVEAVDRVAEGLMASTGSTAPGQRLGAYRLKEELGRGGMGVVYRGVREGDDFEQTVAVKVLPGALFSPETVDHFRNERRILAGLEHPNIARLLDGGTTPEGVPYVIMEYVDGIPLDRYADERGLSLEDRIWLFLAVCDAVQYAHRNLVVHRDLKPSNILVTPEGIPKLLDFGIAKLLNPGEMTGASEERRPPPTATRIMTPRFASPEQLLGKRIGTTSDVYSLGLVLHILLAGVEARGPDDAWIDAMATDTLDGPDPLLRALRDDPVAPSTASGDPGLRGDLDTIVLTALRRDVSERYESVRALADDLERYLTGKPITARPPTLGYRARKFIRRNRGPVLGAVVALVLLVAQTGIFLDRLAGERDVAQREAERATESLRFLTEVFRGVDPFVAADPDLTALEVLSQGAARVEAELADQPAIQAEILDAVGSVYENLGALDSARSAFTRSLAVREATFGPRSQETAYGISQLGGLLIELDEVARADSLLVRSLALRRGLLPPDHPDIAADLGQRAYLAHRDGRLQESDSLFRAALAVIDSPSADAHPDLRGDLLSNHGALLVEMDRLTEAEGVLREALEIRRSLYGLRHPEVAPTLNHLANVRLQAGAHEEAEALYRELLSWSSDLLGRDHPMIVAWENNLSAALRGRSRYQEALEIQERVVERRRATYGEGHGEVALALNNLANLYTDLGRLDEANATLEEALAINRAVYGDEHPAVATNLNNLATMAWRRGEFETALRMALEVLEMDRRLLGIEHEYVATDLTAVGNYHLYLEQLDRAEEPLREGLELLRRIRGDHNPNTANAAAVYADWLIAVGRAEEAESLARESLETRLDLFDEDDLWVALSRSTLGEALTLQRRYEEAESELLRAREVMEMRAPDGDPIEARNEERIETLYRAWGRESTPP
ncbi:MAG: tetratricopeptide repeat protein [Gemmatimonadota bacterium]